MFERFTDQARRIVAQAQEEARTLNHDDVGTEHILLALIREGTGMAAQALTALGITEDAARQQVEEVIGRGRQAPQRGRIPFTPWAKKALELSLREAMALGHNYVGTEHILLAMLREGDSVAAQALTGLGIGHAQVRERVLGLLAGEREQIDPQAQMADLITAAEQLTQVQQDKEAAFDAGEFEAAAALRDREKQLLADKLRLENQVTAGVAGQAILAENLRLRRELQRLRDLLRQHGIEPDSGSARPA